MIVNADLQLGFLQAMGRLPSNYVFAWMPTLKQPFRVVLTSINRCESDGMLVMDHSSQASLGLHLGHRLRGPVRLSIFEFIGVFLGFIR